MSSVPVKFGFPSEWEIFIKTHPVLTEKLELLFGTLNKVFIRKFQMAEPADRVIFYLGRLCVEDFMEILLLCGNGYGIGGLKLLRGLYERAVTAGYIAKNPGNANTFLEYHHVHMGKYFNHAKQIFDMNRLFSPETVKEFRILMRKSKINSKNRFVRNVVLIESGSHGLGWILRLWHAKQVWKNYICHATLSRHYKHMPLFQH